MIQALWSLDQQFQNKNGSILTHGKIYVYYSGRTALATTYSDEDGTVVNPNPIILDNNGRAACFASSMYAYTVVVCDAYGKELFSYDITLHDAVETAEKVFVIGTDGTVQVDTTTLPNGVQYDLSVNTDIIATNELVENVSANIQNQLDNKKDVQEEKSYSGSQTKTITNISQDENGVITVTYEDIDLPPEVPNVEITSPNGTLSVSATTDQATNTKTFSIDVKNDQMQSFIGYYGKSQYEYRPSDTHAAYTMPIGKWDSYTYNGDFITNDWDSSENNVSFELKPGLYLVHAVVMYQMNESQSKKNDAGYIRVATGTHNGWEDGTRYKDWSSEYLDGHECSITVSFIRRITAEEGNNTLYIAPYLPYGVNFACLHELQIVKLDTVVGQGGSGGNDIVIAREYNGVLDDTYDGVKIRQTDNGNEVVGLRKNNSWFTYGQLAPLSAGSDKILITDANGTVHWGVVGNGLEIDNNTLEVQISGEVGDVVETVEKLEKDLDTQLTVNFDMPNVDNVYDFADPSVIGNLSNGAVMLCQAFTVPINHDIRVDDGQTDNPTLVGIYAKQAFAGKKIMLALYVYDFDTGYTDYVGDTGPVSVSQGRNEFPLKHINPNISELKSSCVYYASLYLPSNAHSNGLYLAGCPSYSNASYINATPRFTVGVENITYNNTEIDMTDATTGRLDYNDGNGNYYIGPWSDNYNERPSIPRFFMQIRNGEADTPIVVEPFTDIGTYTLKNTDSISSVFGSSVNVNTSTYGAMFMEVTPAQDVDVTGWVCYDNYATDDRQWYGQVFDSSFENQLSTQSNGTLVELGETSTGSGIYGHEFTRSTPLHLTANTTYRFLVGIPHTDNDLLVQYNTPTVSKNLHLFASGYNVSQWVAYSRANNVQGIDFVIKDANNEWRI
mgnify:FL=1